jgi:D-alanine-D-alanine ligase
MRGRARRSAIGQGPIYTDGMRRLRVLCLMHDYLVPPDDDTKYDTSVAWKTEFDVKNTLEVAGHDVRTVGVGDDLGVVRTAIKEMSPHIVFNLMENFTEVGVFDQNIVSYLELLKVPYTGCNPRGLMLSRDKALSKTLLAYHRIPVPDFAVFRVGRAVQRPKRLTFPLIVKSLTQEASIGISQASVVENDERLRERVHFIHRSVGTDAIVERYIEGRELYVGIIGNLSLTVFPVWELNLGQLPRESWRIATERVKWSASYQKKHDIMSGPATDLAPALVDRIQRLCRRVYRTLDLSGYARVDLRLTDDGRVYVLEANPNPQIAYGEDFAESAEAAGLSYEQLLQRILNYGLAWRPERRG